MGMEKREREKRREGLLMCIKEDVGVREVVKEERDTLMSLMGRDEFGNLLYLVILMISVTF